MNRNNNTACWIGIILIVALIIGFSVSRIERSSLNDKYEELQEQYDDLDEQYESLKTEYESYKETIWSYEDDAAAVWCYFENENDMTFDEARDAFLRMHDVFTGR